MEERIIEEGELVVLVDEDDNEHEFILVDTIEVGEGRYAILSPAEQEEEEESEVIILKVGLNEEGEEVFYDIEDDEEWEKVADAWEESETEEDGSTVIKE